MILLLVLEGKYGCGGATHLTSRRLVSVDTDNPRELADLQRRRTDSGAVGWGLGSDKDGWWRVVDAYELVEPTQELHEGRYPMAAHLVSGDLDEVILAVKAAASSLASAEAGASEEPEGRATSYYLVTEEWNYPTESGRDPHPLTYDTLGDALAACHELAEENAADFAASTGMDCLPPQQCGDGVIVTTKTGLDPFYYYARAVRIEPELGRITEEINRKAKEQHARQEA